MPTEATDTTGVVHKNASAVFMARVVDASDTAITQAGITSGTYSIYLLNRSTGLPDERTDITGHTAVALTIASVVFDTNQTDSGWSKDATGFNFRHVIDIDLGTAFAIAGRTYLVEYTLVPSSGENILIRFRVECI